MRDKIPTTLINNFYFKVLKHFCKRSLTPFFSPVQGNCLQSSPSALEMCLIRSRRIIPLLHVGSDTDRTQSSQKANLAQFLLFPSGENSIKDWLMLEFSSRINKFLMWWKRIVSGKQLSLLFCIGGKRKKKIKIHIFGNSDEVVKLERGNSEFPEPWWYFNNLMNGLKANSSTISLKLRSNS